MSEFTVRPTDPQVTVNGRTFAVRHVLMGGMFDSFVVLEKVGADWLNVGDSAAPKPTDADFATEAAVTAWLQRFAAWINTQFAKILKVTPPSDDGPVLGVNGRADRAIQARIKLTVSGGGVVASVV